MNLKWLETEYPFEQTAIEKRNLIVTISVFGSLLVLFLQPFGFIITEKLYIFFGFLIISIVTLSINYFGFPYYFPGFFEESRWSITKAFTFLLYNFIIISFWNNIYNVIFIKQNSHFFLSTDDLVIIIFRTITVGIVASFFLILGKGTYWYSPESSLFKYTGTWKNNKKHGNGMLFYRNGDKKSCDLF